MGGTGSSYHPLGHCGEAPGSGDEPLTHLDSSARLHLGPAQSFTGGYETSAKQKDFPESR